MTTETSRRGLSDQALKLVADRFRALGEPTRLRILMALESGARNVTEVAALLQASQANISRHLQCLTEAGILRRDRKGLHVYYSVADPRVFELCRTVCGSLEDYLANQVQAFR
jgi:ArsR family transcriptional regulator